MIIVAWMLLLFCGLLGILFLGFVLYTLGWWIATPWRIKRIEKRMAVMVERADRRDEEIFWLNAAWEQPAIGDHERSPSLS